MSGCVLQVQTWSWTEGVVRVMTLFTALFAAVAALLTLQFPSTGRPGDGRGHLSLGDKAVLLLSLGLVDLIARFPASLVVSPRAPGVPVLQFVGRVAVGTFVVSVLVTVLLLVLVLPVALARPDVEMTSAQHTLVFGRHLTLTLTLPRPLQ
jgi:hypothetical protein